MLIKNTNSLTEVLRPHSKAQNKIFPLLHETVQRYLLLITVDKIYNRNLKQINYRTVPVDY
jgi:hypothetical protein